MITNSQTTHENKQKVWLTNYSFKQNFIPPSQHSSKSLHCQAKLSAGMIDLVVRPTTSGQLDDVIISSPATYQDRFQEKVWLTDNSLKQNFNLLTQHSLIKEFAFQPRLD